MTIFAKSKASFCKSRPREVGILRKAKLDLIKFDFSFPLQKRQGQRGQGGDGGEGLRGRGTMQGGPEQPIVRCRKPSRARPSCRKACAQAAPAAVHAREGAEGEEDG